MLAITDGQTIVTLQPAQDHKPAHDGDTGPNTGGMGAYCPAPLVDDEMLPLDRGARAGADRPRHEARRRPFRGVLYAGLMITNQGPKVLEYNVRFGDPECQPLLMRLKTDLLDVLEAAVDGRLDELGPLEWDPRPAVCVVMASEGYPGNYEKGHPDPRPGRGGEAARREGLPRRHRPDRRAASSPPAAACWASPPWATPSPAKLQAYTAVKCIRWDGAWCRKDISDKALGYGK